MSSSSFVPATSSLSLPYLEGSSSSPSSRKKAAFYETRKPNGALKVVFTWNLQKKKASVSAEGDELVVNGHDENRVAEQVVAVTAGIADTAGASSGNAPDAGDKELDASESLPSREDSRNGIASICDEHCSNDGSVAGSICDDEAQKRYARAIAHRTNPDYKDDLSMWEIDRLAEADNCCIVDANLVKIDAIQLKLGRFPSAKPSMTKDTGQVDEGGIDCRDMTTSSPVVSVTTLLFNYDDAFALFRYGNPRFDTRYYAGSGDIQEVASCLDPVIARLNLLKKEQFALLARSSGSTCGLCCRHSGTTSGAPCSSSSSRKDRRRHSTSARCFGCFGRRCGSCCFRSWRCSPRVTTQRLVLTSMFRLNEVKASCRRFVHQHICGIMVIMVFLSLPMIVVVYVLAVVFQLVLLFFWFFISGRCLLLRPWTDVLFGELKDKAMLEELKEKGDAVMRVTILPQEVQTKDEHCFVSCSVQEFLV